MPTKELRVQKSSRESVKTLISKARVQKRIKELAHEIRLDFPADTLHLVGVL